MDLDCRFHLVWTVKKICFEDRRKIASPTDPISAGDLEVTPNQFTCSKGARGEVNPAAQRLERAPVDVLALGADHEPLPRSQVRPKGARMKVARKGLFFDI